MICMIPVDEPEQQETIFPHFSMQMMYGYNIYLVILQSCLIIMQIINRLIEDYHIEPFTF